MRIAFERSICLNSVDFPISTLGITWLQGQSLGEAEAQALGFSVAQERPRRIIESLAWVLSLSGPTILAFDQLDPIVTQHHYRALGTSATEEQNVAQAIIAQIGGGLGALRDTTRRTLTVVSCVESTWEILRRAVLTTFVDRFEPVLRLGAVEQGAVARALIEGRLARGFAASGFSPPYPSWPFRPEAFDELRVDSPREVLKKCDRHRQRCLTAGRMVELRSFREETTASPEQTGQFDALSALDRRFEEFKAGSDPAALLDPIQADEKLAPLLQSTLQCLIEETRLPDQVGAIVDTEFTGGTTTRPLHARLRLIFLAENEREEHYSVRAIERTHPLAYQARLKAAMTQAGIDRALRFRRLCVIRSQPAPSGPMSQELTRRFEAAGGLFLEPIADDLRVMDALDRLRRTGDPALEEWLRERRPASSLRMIREIVPSPLLIEPAAAAMPMAPESSTPKPDNPVVNGRHGSAAVPRRSAAVFPDRAAPFPLGRALIAGQPSHQVEIPLDQLEKHIVILAGSGSGKTVLLRRLVEEAALLGVPSIVVDIGNELVTLDEPWPERPDAWQPLDDRKAARYHDEVRDVVVWTPGRESGRAISLTPLPDLSPFARDDEELDAVVAMVRESLTPIVASGHSAASASKPGTLSKRSDIWRNTAAGTSRHSSLCSKICPRRPALESPASAPLARQMADALRVAVETNPLLRSQGPPLDPALLFGDPERARTRISVINLAGLTGLEPQRAFLNQLALNVFGWLKRHPDPAPRPFAGCSSSTRHGTSSRRKTHRPARKASSG